MERYHKLDEIRGVTLISMILYHGCWDMVYILGYDWAWYHSTAAYLWQQSIAWTFILLSGFCWQLGKRRLRRGLTIFGAGLLVTAVTVVFMPESRIIFGVLTLIGSCMLLMIPVDVALEKQIQRREKNGTGHGYAWAGLMVSGALFLLTRNINRGFLGFEELSIVKLPESWYCNGFTTYLGFPNPEFFSTDYFSLIPWFFLFLCGYFLFAAQHSGLKDSLKVRTVTTSAHLRGKIMMTIRWMGRHSLMIYLAHQPVLYGLALILQHLQG